MDVNELPVRQSRYRRLRGAARLLLPLTVTAGVWLTAAPQSANAAVREATAARSTIPLPVSARPPARASLVRDTGCSVALADTTSYFEAAPPANEYEADLQRGVATHNTDFGDRSQVTFNTCTPKRVLFIGDSIGFTLGFGMLENEQRYGIEIGGDPREGCSFNTAGLLLISGTYQPEPSFCPSEIAHWVADERSFHANAVVVEMGWRDEFDWQINGRDVDLGGAYYRTLVLNAIDSLIQNLGQGHIPILILSVPWSGRSYEPNGTLAPQGSPERHQLINGLINQAASTHATNVRVLNIDRFVSPGNQYEKYVNGGMCRFDGLHFTVFCAQLLQPYVLGEVAQMLSGDAGSRSVAAIAATADTHGYWLVDGRGAMHSFGDAARYGDLSATPHPSAIVAMDATPDGHGYWLVSSSGGVYPFGDATYFGSMAGSVLTKPIVGIASTRDGKGYWLVASDGGVFSFGDARYLGSMGGKHLNEPIVAAAADHATGGYWLVAADGGVFSYRAKFFGSTGSLHLARPIVGMEPMAADNGYRFVASDGGVFDFGAAPFSGSLGKAALTSPVSGMAAAGGSGYWLVQQNGKVTAFGGASTYAAER
jgi:hypothetical protein